VAAGRILANACGNACCALALTVVFLAAPCPAQSPEAAHTAAPSSTAESPPQLAPVEVQAPEPRYVAPTRRDRIGRIWAPVMIDGKGPFRLVLDTGASHSAVTAQTASQLGPSRERPGAGALTGFTGSAIVPMLHADSLEVGDIEIGPTELAVLQDVFGGADGVLGVAGLGDRRIVADFVHDELSIAHSRTDVSDRSMRTVPLRLTRAGLLVADIRVGKVRTQAIIDTGAQGSVGNLALRDALLEGAHHGPAREEIVGVTLDVQTGEGLSAPTINFGSFAVSGMHVTFGDMYLFEHWKLTGEPTLTLGMDVLGSFDLLVIDYDRREMQVRLREG
jgi:predicted aspartyl protease